MINGSIVLTAHRRPTYLRESLESWRKVRGVEDWRFYVFLEPTDRTEKMYEVLNDFDDIIDGVVLNEEKLGVLKNPHKAMSQSFESSADFTVLAEEDIVVTSDVLEYFTWAAETLQDDKKILAALAWSDHLYENDAQFSEVQTLEWFNPLIWGTWRDRWEEVLSPTWDLTYEWDGWDHHLNRQIIPDGGYSLVRPRYSRSQHIGKHEGTHMIPQNYLESTTAFFQPEIPGQNYFLVDRRY